MQPEYLCGPGTHWSARSYNVEWAATEAGVPVARSFLLSGTAKENACALADVDDACASRCISFPMIVKPVRGRGSQGVTLVKSLDALRDTATALIAAATFGDMLMVEEFSAVTR